MKTKKDKLSIYQNLDGEYFFDENTNQFLLKFDEGQKEALMTGLDHHRCIQAIAYPGISAECMKAIVELMPDNESEIMPSGLRRVDYFKVAMAFDDPKDCELALGILANRIDIFREIKDVRKLDSQTLGLIYSASMYGVNVCFDVDKGLRGSELEQKVRTLCLKKEKRARRRAFFETIRRPYKL